MSFIAALLSILNSLAGLFGLNRPKPVDPAVQTAQIANAEASISATTARQTEDATQKELAHVQTQTDATVAHIHDADGLRGVSDAVNAAIAEANADPGAN